MSASKKNNRIRSEFIFDCFKIPFNRLLKPFRWSSECRRLQLDFLQDVWTQVLPSTKQESQPLAVCIRNVYVGELFLIHASPTESSLKEEKSETLSPFMQNLSCLSANRQTKGAKFHTGIYKTSMTDTWKFLFYLLVEDCVRNRIRFMWSSNSCVIIFLFYHWKKAFTT